MQSIDTLTDFLQFAGQQHAATTEYHVYDLSRRVQKLSNQEFAAIERGERPFPTPRQQHAWLAIVLRQQEHLASNHVFEPYIWFVKLPLDERGLFQHAARQHFLSIIVEAVTEDLTADISAEQAKRAQQNPYLFTPDEPRRAAFHAQVSRDLVLPTNSQYAAAKTWLLQPAPNAEGWQQLSVQSIHDVICREINDKALQSAIVNKLWQWPEPLQQTITEALEQQPLSSNFADELCALFTSPLTANQRITLWRCLAGATAVASVQQALYSQLQQLPEPASAALDLLYTIGARLWPLLANSSHLAAYLTAVARRQQSEAVFHQVFRDLVMLAELRPHLLQLLRAEDLNPDLQQALAALITATRSKQ